MNRERTLTMAKPSRTSKPNKTVATSAVASPQFVPATKAANASVSKPGSRIEGKPAAEPTVDQIAAAAYFLWLERGGNETVNWLEAERMLKTNARAAANRA